MAKTDLLPCPFCGGEANIIEYPAHPHSPALVAAIGIPDHPGSWASECQRCGCGLIHATEAEAVAAWNLRAANSDGGVEPWTGKEETYATVVSKWPEWLHDDVDRAMDASDTFDWSTEQVLAYAILMNRRAAKALDGIAVKALKWRAVTAGFSLQRAETQFGDYRIWEGADGSWFWAFNDDRHSDGSEGTPDLAKAVAQADFDQRIRSALAVR